MKNFLKNTLINALKKTMQKGGEDAKGGGDFKRGGETPLPTVGTWR